MSTTTNTASRRSNAGRGSRRLPGLALPAVLQLANVLNVRYDNVVNVNQLNELLSRGEIEREDMWPRLVEYEAKAVPFLFELGLDRLPTEPGLLVVRGPRQYGKSTWLDLELRQSIIDHGGRECLLPERRRYSFRTAVVRAIGRAGRCVCCYSRRAAHLHR